MCQMTINVWLKLKIIIWWWWWKETLFFLSSSCNSHHHHHIFFLSHESITYHDHKINHTHVFFLNTFFSIMISSSLEKKIDVKVYKMGEWEREPWKKIHKFFLSIKESDIHDDANNNNVFVKWKKNCNWL